MTNQVKVTIAGNSQEVQRAMDQMGQQVDKAENKLAKMKDTSKKATGDARRGMDLTKSATLRATQAVAGMAASFLSVGSAIRLVIGEQEKLNRIREQARQANLAPAQAIREAKINFMADATIGEDQFEPEIRKLAERGGVSVEAAARAVSDPLSAKGSQTNRQVFKSVEQALRINPDEEFAKLFAASGSDLSKASGSTDAREVLGFLLNQQAASRVTDLKKLAENIQPAVAGMGAFGDTPEQGAELAAALSQLAFDPQGAQTGTAMLRMGEQLQKFMPGEKSTMDRITALQQDEPLREEFIENLSLDAKLKQPVISLLRGEEKAKRELSQAQEVIQPIGADQIPRFEERVKFLESGQSAIMARTEREAASGLEQGATANTRGARIAESQKVLEEYFGAVDLPGIDSIRTFRTKKILEAKARALPEGEGPESLYASELESQAGALAFRGDDAGSETLRKGAKALRNQAAGFAAEDGAAGGGAAKPAFSNRVAASVMESVLGDAGKSDPQIAEMLRTMKQIADNTGELKRPNPPQTRTPQSAALSRSE